MTQLRKVGWNLIDPTLTVTFYDENDCIEQLLCSYTLFDGFRVTVDPKATTFIIETIDEIILEKSLFGAKSFAMSSNTATVSSNNGLSAWLLVFPEHKELDNHIDCEIVDNEVAGKKFKYCRNHKVEV